MQLELPFDIEDWSTFPWSQTSDTDTEALMTALPYVEPDVSVVARQVMREAMADCLEALGDEDRFILEALWFEGISIRVLATRLGLHKSYVHRISQRAIIRLGQLCIEHPVLSARYVA